VITYPYPHALDALGDPTRRAIFERLAERPLAVVDLAAALPVSRPAVSQHLKVLKEAGLVRDARAGARRIYELDPQGLDGLRDYFERFWNVQLQSFKRRIERPAIERPATGAPVGAQVGAANNAHQVRNKKETRR
jgi:DNA-binding transcriptional ArsR family regulator